MKQLICLCGFLFFAAVGSLQADQLAYISEPMAQKAVNYLTENNIKEVVMWCACCTNEQKVKVSITKVYYRYTGVEKFYEVVIEGTTADGKAVNEAVDLAYIHIKKKNKGRCLGKSLKFECDPCTKPFAWQ